MVEIRVGSVADASAIARVRRESWHAAYAGIIAAPLIDRATATGGSASDPPPYRRTLVAEADEPPAVIGYASFGPERTVPAAAAAPSVTADGQPAPGSTAARSLTSTAPAARAVAWDPLPAGPLTADGRAGRVGELYALYVTSAWWSAGVGRELMGRVLTALEAEGYQRAVLWVLADNARARRFYERAGFAPDGGSNILTGLGGVLEVRYARRL